MSEDTAWSEVSSKFSEVFPDKRPNEWRIIHLLFHNHLTKSGDIRRTVEICLESNIDGLKEYDWRIPLPTTNQTKVYGLSVHEASGELLEYELNYLKKDGNTSVDNPDFALLKILFNPINKGEKRTIKFEYFIENYAIRLSKGLFSSLWKYSWSYRIHSETRKFEHRVIIPPKCKIIKNGFSTNMPSPPLNFSYGEMETMIWMADNPDTGDFIGEVRYKQESAIGLTAVSLASGAFIGALTSLLTSSNSLYTNILIFLVPIVVVFGTINLAKTLLPSQKS